MGQVLRVVSDDRLTVDQAAKLSRRDLLIALREHISQRIDEGVPARDLASLSLRLVKIAEDLDTLDAVVKETDVAHAAATADEAWPAT